MYSIHIPSVRVQVSGVALTIWRGWSRLNTWIVPTATATWCQSKSTVSKIKHFLPSGATRTSSLPLGKKRRLNNTGHANSNITNRYPVREKNTTKKRASVSHLQTSLQQSDCMGCECIHFNKSKNRSPLNFRYCEFQDCYSIFRRKFTKAHKSLLPMLAVQSSTVLR